MAGRVDVIIPILFGVFAPSKYCSSHVNMDFNTPRLIFYIGISNTPHFRLGGLLHIRNILESSNHFSIAGTMQSTEATVSSSRGEVQHNRKWDQQLPARRARVRQVRLPVN